MARTGAYPLHAITVESALMMLHIYLSIDGFFAQLEALAWESWLGEGR